MPPAPNLSPPQSSDLAWLATQDDQEGLHEVEKQTSSPSKDQEPSNATSSIADTKPDSFSEDRKPPSPNTILDRDALIKALHDANMVVKTKHIDYLYESLHWQNYPDLVDFVANYYRIKAESPVAESSISSQASVDSRSSPTAGTSVSSHDSVDSKSSPISPHRVHRQRRLPRRLLNFLSDPNNGFVTCTTTVVSTESSPSGNATRIVLALHDGLLIETQLMVYREHHENHISVSLSSQVGGEGTCSFLPQASMRLLGNLTAGEILEQVVHAQRVFMEQEQVSGQHAFHSHGIVQNVTFMGTGEPLHNYDHVVAACEHLTSRRAWDLCCGRITISTVGITPRIYDLTRDVPGAVLALGLHAPNQALRCKIIPAAHQYPLNELMDALDNHMEEQPLHGTGSIPTPTKGKRRMVMIEYFMSKSMCLHSIGPSG